MSDQNPYAAPATELGSYRSTSFPELSDPELKKMYHRSINVTCIGALFLLGALVSGGIGVATLSEMPGSVQIIVFSQAALYGLGAVGIFMRAPWGRVLGIIGCILSLINIPMGTIIGAFGLFAFFGAPQLFGKDRITHAELKAEYKARRDLARGVRA